MVENSSNYLFGSSVVNSKMMPIFVLDDMHVEGDADDHIVSVDVFRMGWGRALSTSAGALLCLCRVSCGFFWCLLDCGVFLCGSLLDCGVFLCGSLLTCVYLWLDLCGRILVQRQGLSGKGNGARLDSEECQRCD